MSATGSSRIGRLADRICPPPMLSLLHAVRIKVRPPLSGLTGIYPDWRSAVVCSTGYDTELIRDVVVAAAEKAAPSNGRLFDRDGYVFDAPITPFPLVACLLRAALGRADRLTIVDFGGALGATYRQCASFLSGIPLQWIIVEQPAIVEVGQKRFVTKELRFASTLQEAALEKSPDAVIFSGVLQYLDNPYEVLRQAMALDPKMIIIDRNPFSDLVSDAFTLQVVQKELFPARLPFRIFAAQVIEEALLPAYRLFTQFNTVDPNMRAAHVKVKFLGKAFERVLERPGSHGL